MVEFITKGYEPRRKTKTQVENNSRQTAVLGGQTRACQKNKTCQSSSTVLYSLSGASKEGEKGEELLDAKGRDMPFLKLAMSKMSSIISVMGMNVNPSTAIFQMIHIFSYHIPF